MRERRAVTSCANGAREHHGIRGYRVYVETSVIEDYLRSSVTRRRLLDTAPFSDSRLDVPVPVPVPDLASPPENRDRP